MVQRMGVGGYGQKMGAGLLGKRETPLALHQRGEGIS